MILNFIFSNFNAIVLIIWLLFAVIVAIRYFQPTGDIFSRKNFLSKIGKKIGNISFLKTTSNAVGRFFSTIFKILHLNILFTKIGKSIKNISFLKLIMIALGFNIFFGLFISASLYYVWGLSDPSGTFIKLPYFLGYIWTNVWLNISISFFLSGLLYTLFKVWKYYRGGFLEKGPELLLILMLIPGFPKILIFITTGFIFLIFYFIFSYIFKHKKVLIIEPAFIFAIFLTLIFGNIVLGYLYQYSIL